MGIIRNSLIISLGYLIGNKGDHKMPKFKVGDKVKNNKGEYLTIDAIDEGPNLDYYKTKEDNRWYTMYELQLVTLIQEEDLMALHEKSVKETFDKIKSAPTIQEHFTLKEPVTNQDVSGVPLVKDQITLAELLTDPKYTKPGYKFQCFGEDMTMDTQGLLFFQDREVRFHLSQGLLKTIVTITQRPEKHYYYYDSKDSYYWGGKNWVYERSQARVYTEKEVEAYKAFGIPYDGNSSKSNPQASK